MMSVTSRTSAPCFRSVGGERHLVDGDGRADDKEKTTPRYFSQGSHLE